MDERRALLTDREKEILSGEADVTDKYRYQTVSRIRNRIERLGDDATFLQDVRPDLYDDLQVALCRPYKCPRCGEGFTTPAEAHSHAFSATDDQHADYEQADAPQWWPD